MRGIFLAAALLINAPAYADQAREFSAFLDEYTAFSEKRAIQNKSHTARFSGNFTFREGCNNFYSDDACQCPPGNRYLQCLVSAKATIQVDPNDIGGRGYVLIRAEGSALNKNGQWVSANERGVYSTVIEPLAAKHVINIPLPDKATLESFCSGNSAPVSISVGYGAAMPMEIEFARLMKARSNSLGHAYDDKGFIMSQARINGTRSNKGAVVGAIECYNSQN